MLFNMFVANHGEAQYLEILAPLVNYVRATLQLCGHSVMIDPHDCRREAINLLFEHFPHAEFWGAEMRSLSRQGYKVGVIATELLVGGTIPYAKNGILVSSTASEQDKARYFQQRIDGLNAVAPEIDFMWSFLERTAREYESRCRLSRFFPVGHTYPLPPESLRAPKDIDVVFFGTLTRHRADVLRRLTASKELNVVSVGIGTPAGIMPSYILASLLNRAKIGLNLTLSAVEESSPGLDPRFVSCMRVVEMLERDLCVVSEEIPFDNPYRDYVTSSPVEGLTETCLQLLKTGEWRERGLRHAARFREEMDVRKVCAPTLRETLATLGIPEAGS